MVSAKSDRINRIEIICYSPCPWPLPTSNGRGVSSFGRGSPTSCWRIFKADIGILENRSIPASTMAIFLELLLCVYCAGGLKSRRYDSFRAGIVQTYSGRNYQHSWILKNFIYSFHWPNGRTGIWHRRHGPGWSRTARCGLSPVGKVEFGFLKGLVTSTD
jgi:hypothetical protein